MPLGHCTGPTGRIAHTYSIVARDSDTGQMGVAVQSHWFSVGSVVSWAEAGVGAIATQAMVNVSYGSRGLGMLRDGDTALQAAQRLLKTDDCREMRQLAVVDSSGNVAAHTGEQCIREAGHEIGDGFSVQANMMLNDTVWPSMAAAFQRSGGPLAERMIAALEAADAAGGDVRGRQSASLLVVRGESTDRPWEDRLIDLRVDDHPDPVAELKRLLRLFRAYEHMNNGDLALERGDSITALREYGSAEEMFPDNLEMRFWHAVSLANLGRVDESLSIFEEVFRCNRNWALLARRLPAVGMLGVDDQDLSRILAAAR